MPVAGEKFVKGTGILLFGESAYHWDDDQAHQHDECAAVNRGLEDCRERSAEEDILSSIAAERQMCDTQEQNAHLAPASADERPSRRGSSKNEERGTELCVKD